MPISRSTPLPAITGIQQYTTVAQPPSGNASTVPALPDPGNRHIPARAALKDRTRFQITHLREQKRAEYLQGTKERRQLQHDQSRTSAPAFSSAPQTDDPGLDKVPLIQLDDWMEAVNDCIDDLDSAIANWEERKKTGMHLAPLLMIVLAEHIPQFQPRFFYDEYDFSAHIQDLLGGLTAGSSPVQGTAAVKDPYNNHVAAIVYRLYPAGTEVPGSDGRMHRLSDPSAAYMLIDSAAGDYFNLDDMHDQWSSDMGLQGVKAETGVQASEKDCLYYMLNIMLEANRNPERTKKNLDAIVTQTFEYAFREGDLWHAPLEEKNELLTYRKVPELLQTQSLKYAQAGSEASRHPAWKNSVLRSEHPERRVTPETHYQNNKQPRLITGGYNKDQIVQVNTAVERLVSRTLKRAENYLEQLDTLPDGSMHLRQTMLKLMSGYAFRETHTDFRTEQQNS